MSGERAITRRALLRAAATGAAWAWVSTRPGRVRRAAAEARPGYGGHVVASLTSAPLTWDPLGAWSYADATLVGLVFDTLYRVDARGNLVPQLAAAPPEVVSTDAAGHVVRVRLRRGVRFHDGRELTAADVAASLTRAAKSAAAEWALADVERVAAVAGGDAVQLTLRRAAPDLALLLSAPQLAITPAGKPPPGKAPVGTGPFRVEASATRRVELAAFAAHFAGRPYLDHLTLRWFEQAGDEARAYEVGDADVSVRGAVAFAGHQPKYATEVVDGTAMWLGFLGFGRAHAKLTNDPAFRSALSLALGRAAFKHVGSGERVIPALAPESPDLGGAAPDATQANARPDAAHIALRDAAKQNDELRAALAGEARLRLSLIFDRTRLDDADVAARVVASLDAVGLAASYEALDPAEHARRVAAGACDLWLGQLLAPTPDPLHEILAAFAAGGDRWAAGERRAGKLDRARAAAEFGKRWPVLPLYHRAVRAHHRRTLHGVGFDAQGRVGFADVFGEGAGGGRGPGTGGGKK